MLDANTINAIGEFIKTYGLPTLIAVVVGYFYKRAVDRELEYREARRLEERQARLDAEASRDASEERRDAMAQQVVEQTQLNYEIVRAFRGNEPDARPASRRRT